MDGQSLPLEVVLEFFRRGITPEDVKSAKLVISDPFKVKPEILSVIKSQAVKYLLERSLMASLEMDTSVIRMSFKDFEITISAESAAVHVLIKIYPNTHLGAIGTTIDAALTLLLGKLKKEKDMLTYELNEVERALAWFRETWKGYSTNTEKLDILKRTIGNINEAIELIRASIST